MTSSCKCAYGSASKCLNPTAPHRIQARHGRAAGRPYRRANTPCPSPAVAVRVHGVYTYILEYCTVLLCSDPCAHLTHATSRHVSIRHLSASLATVMLMSMLILRVCLSAPLPLFGVEVGVGVWWVNGRPTRHRVHTNTITHPHSTNNSPQHHHHHPTHL